ncbi:MAG: four helix bundle protein [Candidatus Gracilibacteria bacterium]
MIYDLEERLCKFSKSIIEFIKTAKKSQMSENALMQLLRSGTSIGANYCEADNSESKKDFIHKIGICRKESKETKYWLKIIEYLFPNEIEKISPLQQEAKEINLILNSIYIKLKNG